MLGAQRSANALGTMDVAGWLRLLGLGQYETAFRENSVTPDLLPKLTPEDLKDLGITSVGHRRRLLEAIGALRSNEVPAASPDQAPQAPATALASIAERRPLSVMFCDVVGFTALRLASILRT